MARDTGHSFSAYYKRAVSPIIVLSLLNKKSMYGYEISSQMNRLSNNKLGIAVMYPVLYRLVEQGFISVGDTVIENGRAREYYAITESGRIYLNNAVSEYKELSELFINIVTDNQEEEQ